MTTTTPVTILRSEIESLKGQIKREQGHIDIIDQQRHNRAAHVLNIEKDEVKIADISRAIAIIVDAAK